MKSQKKQKVLALHQDGMTVKEIAQELEGEVSKATVYRWIKELEEESDFLNGIVDDEPQLKNKTDLGDADSDELDGIDDEEDDDLSGLDEEEDLSGYDDDDEELSGFDEDQEEEQASPEDESSNEVGIKKRKRTIEKKVKKLFNAIQSHSSGHEWSHSQIRRMLIALNKVQEDIEDLSEYDSEVFKQNAYWAYLETFIGLFQSFSNAGGDVELNFDEELHYEINVVINIQEFDEEYNWDNVIDARLKRLTNDLAIIDNQKIDAEQAYDFQTRINGLIEVLKESDKDSTYREELISLKGLKKDFKRLSGDIEESFWGSAIFELDEDLLITQE